MSWQPLITFGIMLGLAACRTQVPSGSGGGAKISSLSIGKFAPNTGDPEWTKMQIVMPRLDGDLKRIDQTFDIKDFQVGTVQNQTIVVAQGKYTIDLIYSGADSAVVYSACASAKAKEYEINTPTFLVDIPICKPGSTTAIGSTPVSSTSAVTVIPKSGDGNGTTNQSIATNPPTAQTSSDSGTLNTGFATYFDKIGTPAGGCGVPEEQLDSPNYVALNVQITPKEYTSQTARPNLRPESTGLFANGLNCGRWVHVTLTKACAGFNNNGTKAENLCPDASLVPHPMAGASLDMIVADSCQDGNGWCRDDKFHLDLHRSSLAQFTKDNKTVDVSTPWGNPQITWQFIKAPNYTGDIKIGLGANWQKDYLPIILTHLENGLHGVEVELNGKWESATMTGDNGQSYVLPNAVKPPYKIRVKGADDLLINGGRVYQFTLPTTCGGAGVCPAAYTKVDYTILP